MSKFRNIARGTIFETDEVEGQYVKLSATVAVPVIDYRVHAEKQYIPLLSKAVQVIGVLND